MAMATSGTTAPSRLYEQAIELNPHFLDALANRGQALAATHRYAEAMATYRQFNESWFHQVELCDRWKWHQAAIDDANQTTQTKLKQSEQWYFKAKFQSGLKPKLASLEKALQINPNDHHIWNAYGNTLAELGQFESALAAYDKAVQLKPNLSWAWSNRVSALEKLGRYDEALSAYEWAIRTGRGLVEEANCPLVGKER